MMQGWVNVGWSSLTAQTFHMYPSGHIFHHSYPVTYAVHPKLKLTCSVLNVYISLPLAVKCYHGNERVKTNYYHNCCVDGSTYLGIQRQGTHDVPYVSQRAMNSLINIVHKYWIIICNKFSISWNCNVWMSSWKHISVNWGTSMEQVWTTGIIQSSIC
jgi:hypothetical protein